jgi:cobalamin synthase
MKHWSIRIVVGVLGAACVCSVAMAKLPAPAEPTQEAKAVAAAAAAKAAWGSKVAAFKLCLAQDKAVASYTASARSVGKEVKPATPTPVCADPGPYVVAAAEPAEPAKKP